MKKKKWSIVVIVIAVIVIIGAAAGGSSAKKVSSSDGASQGVSSNTTPSSDKTTFGIGDTAELKSVQMTLVNAEEFGGADFFTPQDGYVFVGCEFEIANNSKNEINVSSYVSFNAYCDGYAISQSMTGASAWDKNGKKTLDGTVAPGKKLSGVIVYEVQSDWKELEVSYSPSFWGKAMTFIVPKN